MKNKQTKNKAKEEQSQGRCRPVQSFTNQQQVRARAAALAVPALAPTLRPVPVQSLQPVGLTGSD
jgi:hypothetical protein